MSRIRPHLVSFAFALGFSLILYYFFLLPFDYSLPLPWLRHFLLLSALYALKITWRGMRWVLLGLTLVLAAWLLSAAFREYLGALLLEGESAFQQILQWTFYPGGDPPALFLPLWSLISVLCAFFFYALIPSAFLALTLLALPLFLNFSVDAKAWLPMLLAGFLCLIPLFGQQKAGKERSWQSSPLLLLILIGVFAGGLFFSEEDLFSQDISDFLNENRSAPSRTDPLSNFSLSIFGLYEGDAPLSGRPVTDNTPYLSVGPAEFTSYLGIRKYYHFDEVLARWHDETAEEYLFARGNPDFPIEEVFPRQWEAASHETVLQYRFLQPGPDRLFHGGAPRSVTSSARERISYTPFGEILRTGSDLNSLYTVAGQFWDRDLLDEEYERMPAMILSDREIPEPLAAIVGELRGLEALVFLRSYLQSHFLYDDSVQYPLSSRDFLQWFTDRERGFCVHYATAMTLFSRQLGFDSRYVEGFILPPRRETLGAYEAHAWSEVLIPGYGWVPFDATPSSYQSLLVTRGAPAPVSAPGEPGWEEEELARLPREREGADPADRPDEAGEGTQSSPSAGATDLRVLGILLFLLLLLWRVIRFRLRHFRPALDYRFRSNPRKLVRSVLRDMERLLALAGVDPPVPWSASVWMKKTLYPYLRVSSDILLPALAALETSLYGPKDAKKEEVDALLKYYHRLEIKTRREMPFPLWLLRRVLLPGFFIG